MIRSIDPIYNREQIFKSNEQTGQGVTSNSGGKSGSFFFFTEDEQLLVKTISNQEKKVLLAMLPDMHEHFINSKLSRLAVILGIF